MHDVVPHGFLHDYEHLMGYFGREVVGFADHQERGVEWVDGFHSAKFGADGFLEGAAGEAGGLSPRTVRRVSKRASWARTRAEWMCWVDGEPPGSLCLRG